MGGHPYMYAVPFQDDVEAALQALRKDVFERGAYFLAERRPRSIKEAVDQTDETGTRSILDIERIAATPRSRHAAPFTPEELARYFGPGQPTARMVEESDDLWEELERGEARYLVTDEPDGTKQLVFVGYSFD